MKKNRTFLVLAFMAVLLFCLSACDKENGDVERNETTDNSRFAENISHIDEREYMSDDAERNEMTGNSRLAENIISHIDEWEYISDDFTKGYTYDDVESTGLYLYSADKQGEYYLGVVYSIPTSKYGRKVYHRIYYVTDSEFKYVYGSEYSNEDKTVKECKLLSVQWFQKGADKKDYINNLISDGLISEEKYFSEINLNTSVTIELTEEQNELFSNMYNAIRELEYYDPRYSGSTTQIPLAKIAFYNLGGGKCEVLLYHGYKNEYVSGTTYTVGGYSIDKNRYSRLSDSEESRLENTSNIIELEWNVDWKDEKKEYMLKQSIYENC